MIEARRLHVAGIVQGVGFRPFVYRIARTHAVTGWVRNAASGVEIHAEGTPQALSDFAHSIAANPPSAARVASLETFPAPPEGFTGFVILETVKSAAPTVRVSPDLPVCDECLKELFDPSDRRYRYPYINCTNCGPRFSIIRALPYDRPMTTMREYPMCERCAAEYDDPADRRYHAQPIACAQCGPNYRLMLGGEPKLRAWGAIEAAAQLLRDGRIVAVKGIGGYHLACDARNVAAVAALRERKYRKERPFALMVRDVQIAKDVVDLTAAQEALLRSTPRPIVLVPARTSFELVAPANPELGVMLPYAPLHHLLFDAGAPDALVMTSANRSSEPIAYEDSDALQRLAGIADAFLAGDRPIARRIDDSVVRASFSEVCVLRHARGYAPQALAALPAKGPILALGADLKSAIALVVDGAAFGSQHIGDLDQYSAFAAFKATIADFAQMYEISLPEALVVHDAHPQYVSTAYAHGLSERRRAVQHHRAHVASVLAERGAFEETVAGFAFDGTGYGDDGTIWGGEIFTGSIASGFARAAHLRVASLPGGDAAAQFPVQAAAGFLDQLGLQQDLAGPPFCFPRERYEKSRALLRSRVRTFSTTSVGRLFDCVAALLGFTRPITFEGQAAMWLEHRARESSAAEAFPFPYLEGELDFRPALQAIVEDRLRGRAIAEIAYAFHAGLAQGILTACHAIGIARIVVSGGVFQNALLVDLIARELGDRLWTNRRVPPNDGGISLGQAALACVSLRTCSTHASKQQMKIEHPPHVSEPL